MSNRVSVSSYRRGFVLLGVAAMVFLTSCQAAPAQETPKPGGSPIRVWATSDGVRVNPVTGKYFEDRTDIHKDYPTGEYAKRNAVWDAAKRRVTLHAARNEFVSFQVVVAKGDSAPLDRTVNAIAIFRSLTGPDGAKIDGKNVSLFKAWYVKVTRPSARGFEPASLGQGWYPDALVPASSTKGMPLSIPDAVNGIGASQRNQTVWVDIYVPRDRKKCPPGTYTGELGVYSRGGKRMITVALKVWDFALPEEIHCRGDIWNGTLKRMPPKQEMQYYQMAKQHRFQPGVCFYRPKLTVEGTNVSIDWTEYDKRVGPYLDGTAFTDKYGYWGPGYGVPIQHIILPFDCEKGSNRSRAWPIAPPKEGRTKEFEAVWVETAKQVKAHFDADPARKKVEKIIFLDSLDESYNKDAYEKMVYYCKLLRRGLGKEWFKFRIDGGYKHTAMEKLHPYIGLWVCHTKVFDEEWAKVSRFRKKGVETWFYGPIHTRFGGSGSNTCTDLDLLSGRGIGWLAWKLKSGYCQWEFDAHWLEGRAFEPERSWTEAVNYRKNYVEANGSGLLIYRGKFIGLKQPVPSIRLKAHRRGFQDYEYFWLLSQAGKGDQADRLVDSVIHAVPFGASAKGKSEFWKNNPEAWDAVRIKIGEMLHVAASP